MRLTLIIASVIFSALFAYAKLLEVTQDATRGTPYVNMSAPAVYQANLDSSHSN